MTTMLEVAHKAGVSKATVSRVLSGNGYVSPATKERVFNAIKESGYRPNLLARNLATRKSQSIGLVVTNTLYHGTYFSELLFQVARMTEDHGRQLILADGKHSAEEERAAIQFLLDLRCDAIIIYPRFISIDALDEIIHQHKQPIMVINRKLLKNDSYCIYTDHKESSFRAVNYLIEQGHHDIAFITGSLDSPTGLQRLSGYKEALERHRIPLNNDRIYQGKWTPASGAAAVRSLLDKQVSFSAMVASNDDMAIGALKALSDAGIDVPHQVSLLGFDDIPMAPYCRPALSSVRIPVSEMITAIVDKLVDILDGGEINKRQTFIAELMIRDSVAKGPGGTICQDHQ